MWSKDSPTEQGWYWFRTSMSDPRPMVVKVSKAWGGLMEMFTVGTSTITIIGLGGEWQPVKPWEDA